ncbi:hypothetical protein [Flavobacterium turcicum]|uniref:Uncharacterized protein n=1 Tax=Flavobacterium turcicum TaxID=2764718 RepID=A0ABR7JJ09_9FLAO|nr:hypothetical protein [Flavobacterium turcicum]MBC5864483.1 hypothetical protein [Flavobacterium turcicum]NHL03251.1 hypothetical protein [Flavobacterium turcicum]
MAEETEMSKKAGIAFFILIIIGLYFILTKPIKLEQKLKIILVQRFVNTRCANLPANLLPLL